MSDLIKKSDGGLPEEWKGKLLEQTVLQAEKDLRLSGFDFHFRRPYDASGVVGELQEFIASMLDTHRFQITQLMYRVDLSESLLAREIEGKSAQEASRSIALLILQREMQKVNLRRRFSEGGDYDRHLT